MNPRLPETESRTYDKQNSRGESLVPTGPIEILVRSINHDGQSMLRPVIEAIEAEHEAYGRASLDRPELAEAHGPKLLRECQQTANHISSQMLSVGKDYELGVTSSGILSKVRSNLQELCSALHTKAELVAAEAVRERISTENGGTLLVRACAELESYVGKMVSIGARIVESKEERVSLETEFKRVLGELRGRHLGVEFERTGRFRQAVLANRGVIYLLFRELVSNSFKYREDGRKLRLVTQQVESQGIITISLSDNGIGIPPEYCESDIFRSGFRAAEAIELDKARRYNSGGQGLGLAIVKQIVDHLKGRIRATGEPGAGTRFEISFSHGL
jgi:signal transduction histidine kinase